MAVKTTGAEYKAYLDETGPAWWPKGAYIDDDVITVDGKAVDDADFDPGKLADTADVVILAGSYYRSARDDSPLALETHFKRWRKAQTTVRLVVEVDKSKVEAVTAAIQAAGGKVLK